VKYFFDLRLRGLAAVVMLTLLVFPGSLSAADTNTTQVKDLNFVFLHGMGGTTCTLQNLGDWIEQSLPSYAFLYEQEHPGIRVKLNMLARCYEGYVKIDQWAENIVESIETHFKGKDNLILVGHSMGGKTALYAVANNIGGLADRVAAVVTINSPIKRLGDYYAPSGGPVINYCSTVLLGSDEGVCTSVTNYDSAADGKWVADNKDWLAFISAEAAPLSPKFDRTGVDAWPRDMDDGVVPISAQYGDGANVVYYGEYGHSEFGTNDDPSEYLANQILSYVFGYPLECCLPYRSGTFEHSSDWLLGTDYWNDIFGEDLVAEGVLTHYNESFFKWAEWEETIGELIPGEKRSSTLIRQTSLPLLTRIKNVRWVTESDTTDARVSLNLSAAPRTTIEAEWAIYRSPLLPEKSRRAYCEVNITDGTPLVAVTQIDWLSENVRDVRVRVWSEAQSPFRWFKAEWHTFFYETRILKLIDKIPATDYPAD